MNGAVKMTLLCSAVAVLCCLPLASGCGREPGRIEDRALEAYGNGGFEGTPDVLVDLVAVSPDGEEPSANEAMAIFILDRAGESIDLSTYETIALVTFTEADGSVVRGVMIDGGRIVFAEMTSAE